MDRVRGRSGGTVTRTVSGKIRWYGQTDRVTLIPVSGKIWLYSQTDRVTLGTVSGKNWRYSQTERAGVSDWSLCRQRSSVVDTADLMCVCSDGGYRRVTVIRVAQQICSVCAVMEVTGG